MSDDYVYDFKTLPPKTEFIEGAVYRDLVDPVIQNIALTEYHRKIGRPF